MKSNWLIPLFSNWARFDLEQRPYLLRNWKSLRLGKRAYKIKNTPGFFTGWQLYRFVTRSVSPVCSGILDVGWWHSTTHFLNVNCTLDDSFLDWWPKLGWGALLYRAYASRLEFLRRDGKVVPHFGLRISVVGAYLKFLNNLLVWKIVCCVHVYNFFLYTSATLYNEIRRICFCPRRKWSATQSWNWSTVLSTNDAIKININSIILYDFYVYIFCTHVINYFRLLIRTF